MWIREDGSRRIMWIYAEKPMVLRILLQPNCFLLPIVYGPKKTCNLMDMKTIIICWEGNNKIPIIYTSYFCLFLAWHVFLFYAIYILLVPTTNYVDTCWKHMVPIITLFLQSSPHYLLVIGQTKTIT